MPIIDRTDLYTHLYAEIVDEITRADGALVDTAIAAAIQEAKTYLARYDLMQLFGDETTAPAVDDQYLKTLVKDIACWRLIKLCNTGIDYATFRTAYLDAIAALTNIMKGLAQPGWPYANNENLNMPDGTAVSWHSNTRRENHY